MAETVAQLDFTLTKIMDDAPNVRAQIKVGARVESEFFAKTYLWWRDASQQDGYSSWPTALISTFSQQRCAR